MKKILIALSFILPLGAFAAPTSWDFASSILQPLQSQWTAQVKVPYITATSTTQDNTLPKLVFTTATGTSATTTNFHVSSFFNFDGVAGDEWSDFCEAITGGSGLCDGTDNTGSGGSGLATSTAIADTEVIFGTSESDVGSEPAFTYDDATNILSVDHILSLASSTLQTLTFTNATGTNATTTNFFSTTGTFTNIFGTLIGNVTGDLTGTADLADALSANGANCGAGSYPLGVDDAGASEDCTDATTEINSAIATHAGDAEAHQDLVTLAGEDYASLSGQQITFANVDAANVNLADNYTWTGTHIFDAITRSTTTQATTTNFAISSLTSALLLTNANGTLAEYTGTSCTNELVRSLSVLGVATCDPVVSADITDGTITADDLGADSVSASELNATGVETELEAVLDLDALQGAVTDAQVPDTITIDLAALATNVSDTDFGDVTVSGGAWAVENDSHAHTGASLSGIDISDDTNLTAGDNLTLTGDDLDLDTTITGLTSLTSTNLISTNATATNATSTNLNVSGQVDFDTLTSALIQTGAGGVLAEYAGTSCTNQFVRSLSALGAATCATVVAADVDLADLTATNSTLTFSGTYDGQTARTIGLNLANANTWTGGQIFANATATNATTTSFAISSIASGNCLQTTTGGAIIGSGSACGSGSGGGNSKWATSTDTKFIFPNTDGVAASIGTTSPTGLATLTVSATSTDTTTLLSLLNDTRTQVASVTDEGLLTATAGLTTSGTVSGRMLQSTGDGTAFALISSSGTVTGNGSIAFALAFQPTFDDTVGALGVGAWINPSTEASSFTMSTMQGIRVTNGGFGAGSAVTTLQGIYIGDMTGATNNYSLYSDGGQSYFKDNVGIGTTTPKWALQVASSTRSQFTLSTGTAGTDHLSFRWTGSMLYIASSSNSTYATSTNPALSLDTNKPASLSVGSTTPTLSAVNGLITAGSNGTSGTTTISTGKIQFDGYNSAGTRVCAYVVGTAWVVSSGACTP